MTVKQMIKIRTETLHATFWKMSLILIKAFSREKTSSFEELENFDRQIFPNAIPVELYQLLYNPDVVALPYYSFYHRGKNSWAKYYCHLEAYTAHQPYIFF